MRSGTGQKLPTGSPLIVITVDGDTHTSEGGGGNDRLMRVYTDEQGWGGQFIIELDNADESLSSESYEGEQLTLNLSFIGESSGDFAPLWVYSQQLVSREGELRLQLNCIDIWGLIAAHNVALANASYNQQWQQEAELSTRLLPDGETLLSDGAPTLYAALLANGDKTIWGVIQDLATAVGVTVTKDDDDGYIDTLKPPVSFGNARAGMRMIMDMTESYLKWKTNGQLGVYQPSNHSTVYDFNTLDLFESNFEEVAVAIPNRVTFWAYNADGDAWISGTATDSESYGKLGQYIDRHYLVATMDTLNKRTQAQLEDYAAGALAKIQGEGSQGMVVAPMHCTLELFDKIQVTDDRYDTPRVSTGYVHRMVREYDRGVYQITIYLGGVVSGYTVPGGADVPGLADSEPPEAPADTGEFTIPVGYQSYIADVDFTSVDWDTVSWAAGTVYFGDGSSQSIDSGSFDMTADGAWYFYAISGNSTLQHTQTATDATGDDRVLVAVASRGSTTDYNAYVLNPFTDSILINTDKVMDGLVTTLKLSDEAVTNAKIAVNAIQGDVIAASAITETKIGNNAISTGKIQTGAITAGKIDTGAVTATKIAADAVTASKIDAGAVTAQAIAAGAVTTIKLDAYAVDATKIAANAITSDKIYAGAITADKLEANLVLSSVIKTASSGDRIVLDSDGCNVIDSGILFYYSTQSPSYLRGSIWGGSSKLQIESANGDLVLYTGGEVTFTLASSGEGVRMSTADWLILPQRTSAPTPSDGMLIFNPNTGYTNVYSSHDVAWHHFNRDAGWA